MTQSAPSGDHHLDPDDLVRRSTRAATGHTLKRALAHLREHRDGCPTCRRVLGDYPPSAFAGRAGVHYDAVISRAGERGARLEEERRAAAGLLQELGAAGDRARVEAMLLSNPRFRTVGLVLEVVDGAKAALDEGDPAFARGTLGMAACLAEQLDRGLYGDSIIEDLLTLTHAHRSSAALRTFRAEEAASAVSRAEEHLRRGSKLSVLAHTVALARAELNLAQGRISEVWNKMPRVIGWAPKAEDYRLLCIALRLQAQAARLGRPVSATAALAELTKPMRGVAAPGLEAALRLELVASYHAEGDLRNALATVTGFMLLESLYALIPFRARALLWMGRLLSESERDEAAIPPLTNASALFASVGLSVESIGAVAELAAALIERHRRDEVRELAATAPDLLLTGWLPGWSEDRLFALMQAMAQRDASACRAIGLQLARIARGDSLPPGSPESFR